MTDCYLRPCIGVVHGLGVSVLSTTLKELAIIPWAQMGSESIAQEAEGRMGYWLRGHESERNNCFSKIQLVGQKYRGKTTLAI